MPSNIVELTFAIIISKSIIIECNFDEITIIQSIEIYGLNKIQNGLAYGITMAFNLVIFRYF